MVTTTHPPAALGGTTGRPGSTTRTVEVGAGPLTIEDVVDVARHGARVRLADAAVEAMAASRAVVEGLADDDRPHYGVSTGFGALARRHIPVERRAQLQLSLVRSHAAGSGREVEREVVRALQLLRLATLATGRTGARPVVAQTYAAMLDAGVTPVVREFGSLGCSGDLAPLAHVALAALGEGEARDATGALVPAADALAAAGVAPLALREKEGLALINGTDGMLGMLALALHDLRSLLTTADVAAAASVEALLGSDAPFAADLVAMRPHPGQAASAANLRALLDGSPVVASHRTLDADGRPECTRVQDAYSLRCAPQVHGAARDTLDHAAAVARRELAAAIDNPVVTVDGRVESNGNFHGAPIAYVLDFLAIAAADVASMSERRTDRFLDKARNEGLPPFLADDPGVDSGLMIAQYTAAGIVSELKRLAVPSSVDSIPSSAMQEDHVSMGWAGARKLRRAVDGLGRVLAIELLTATRALDLRCAPDPSAPRGPSDPSTADGSTASLVPARGTGAVRDLVRTVVAGPGPDRYLSPEIEAVTRLVTTGAVTAAASAAVGHLA
ncbi:histidine ammonia-lyase [Cellulosimicrobium cellulans]|uniref:histidine ammonia-lyase n=1 Tax=Cellulosimicrobium cellulans TaxID=1710 RepID=UPI0036655571